MAAFATETELKDWLQLTAISSATAALALAAASGDIRDYCGWPISQATVTGEVFDGPGERSLWLETLRLTAVGPVVENGTTLTVVTDYDWTRYGKLIRAGCWPRTPRSVTVTYTHGYAAVPESVKGVCLRLAGHLYNNPGLLKSRSEDTGPFQESVTFSYSPDPAAEMAVLGRYKLEHVG